MFTHGRQKMPEPGRSAQSRSRKERHEENCSYEQYAEGQECGRHLARAAGGSQRCHA